MRSVPEIIAERRVQILERWLEDARRAASARGLQRPQLTNMIPEYIATLGHSASGDPPTGEQRSLLEHHLSHRLRQGFDVDEVIREFSVLVRVLRDLLSELAPDERPSEEDVARLFHELHAATVVVTSIYSEHLSEDEQLEKRYARLIQEVVSDAIHAGNGGTLARQRLGEILGLVREALAADGAALFLYDPASDCLVLTASDGFDEDVAVEPVPLTRSSFVGRVGLERNAIAVRGDTSDPRFEFFPPLRGAGMRSLLGVPLETVRTLVGVMYVAARDVREFTPTDLRRLESLGDRIALHLDNAQLSARLRDKVAQLELFIDVLAHDLRGPLTTARMAARMLRDEVTAGSAPLDKLDRSLHRIERMATDLLDAHRVAAGEALPLHVALAAVGGIVDDAVDELESRLRTRVVVRGDGQMRGLFDPDLVRRAVWNLVVNALKYGAADAPVKVDIQTDARGFVVSVHNDGLPIPPAEQALLFRPFARVRAHGGSTKDGPAGWGLGLSLVAGCAATHGGSVSVDSGAAGTTFRLTIPWQRPAAEPAAPTMH